MEAILHTVLLTLLNGLVLVAAVYPVLTRWDDIGADEDAVRPNIGPPWWYDAEKQPCGCELQPGVKHPADQLRVHVGYSDSTYILWRCRRCGTEWYTHLEG